MLPRPTRQVINIATRCGSNGMHTAMTANGTFYARLLILLLETPKMISGIGISILIMSLWWSMKNTQKPSWQRRLMCAAINLITLQIKTAAITLIPIWDSQVLSVTQSGKLGKTTATSVAITMLVKLSVQEWLKMILGWRLKSQKALLSLAQPRFLKLKKSHSTTLDPLLAPQ